MRTIRCSDCSEPIAAFVEPPAGLPFAAIAGLPELDQAAQRHQRHCVAVAFRRPGRARPSVLSA